jgi:hypothetical protein
MKIRIYNGLPVGNTLFMQILQHVSLQVSDYILKSSMLVSFQVIA